MDNIEYLTELRIVLRFFRVFSFSYYINLWKFTLTVMVIPTYKNPKLISQSDKSRILEIIGGTAVY